MMFVYVTVWLLLSQITESLQLYNKMEGDHEKLFLFYIASPVIVWQNI